MLSLARRIAGFSWKRRSQESEGHEGLAAITQFFDDRILEFVWEGHFAGGDFGFGGAVKAKLAVAEGIAFTHADRRPEDAAGHGPPGVDIAQARAGIERRARGVIGEALKEPNLFVRLSQCAGREVAGKIGPILFEPGVGTVLDLPGKGGVVGSQIVHAFLEAHCIERVDGEGAMAALRAAGAAEEPGSGARRGIDESSVHDLKQLGISVRQGHTVKNKPREHDLLIFTEKWKRSAVPRP